MHDFILVFVALVQFLDNVHSLLLLHYFICLLLLCCYNNKHISHFWKKPDLLFFPYQDLLRCQATWMLAVVLHLTDMILIVSPNLNKNSV